MIDQDVLQLKNITKRYPGVLALDDVSVSFRTGEVHALLGENGAGKSTLIKVISGAISPDAGSICVDGYEYHSLAPAQAKKHGIEVIYQEFNLVDSLSVAENICLGERNGRFVNYNAMRKKAEDVFTQMGVYVPVDCTVSQLPAAQQQLVEIAKAISRNAKLLIMDEPSAPLSLSEVEKMFAIIRLLKAKGVTIIYISHRMDEIFEISDRVTVMRDGRYVKTFFTQMTSRNELVRMMVGRDLSESYPQKRCPIGEALLELRAVSGNGDKHVSLTLHRGEILGLAGLVGAGRTELARLIYGADRLEEGDILVRGRKIKNRLPVDAISNGIGLIPEDRKQHGCFLEKSIDWNITISSIRQMAKGLWVDRKQEETTSKHYSQKFRIKTPNLKQLVKNLSGGNQQKVVIAKTIAANSEILIFDEPTRGIDVGAKQEIYALMCELAEQGKAIMMITSDMAELLGMSDRIVVLSGGCVSGEILKDDFSQIRVLELASAHVRRYHHDGE